MRRLPRWAVLLLKAAGFLALGYLLLIGFAFAAMIAGQHPL